MLKKEARVSWGDGVDRLRIWDAESRKHEVTRTHYADGVPRHVNSNDMASVVVAKQCTRQDSGASSKRCGHQVRRSQVLKLDGDEPGSVHGKLVGYYQAQLPHNVRRI